MLWVWDIPHIDERTSRLKEAGYIAWGEYGLAGRRYFTKDHVENRTHNLHIDQTDHPDSARHLAFCAYLRHHAQSRSAYEILKREAYARHPVDIAAYNDDKDAWIKQIEPVAIAWYRRQVR